MCRWDGERELGWNGGNMLGISESRKRNNEYFMMCCIRVFVVVLIVLLFELSG